MAISTATKLRWFDRGSAAFEDCLRRATRSCLGGHEPLYPCPICSRPFLRTSVQDGGLTVEHVPPESFGGDALLLTCKTCNNTAGAILDADARRREHVENTSFGIAEIPLRARTVIAGQRVHGRVQQGDKGLEFKIDKANNSPAASAAVAATSFKAGMGLELDFAGERYSELGANISWLRSAYLALVAFYGYELAFDSAYEIVRRQILFPDNRLIYSWMLPIPERVSFKRRGIVSVRDDYGETSLGAVFGRHAVLCPRVGDDTFYDRLAARIRRRPNERVNHECTVLCDWPSEPLFGRASR
jgi:hypothetical protein